MQAKKKNDTEELDLIYQTGTNKKLTTYLLAKLWGTKHCPTLMLGMQNGSVAMERNWHYQIKLPIHLLFY